MKMKKWFVYVVFMLTITMVLGGCTQKPSEDIPLVTSSLSVDFTKKTGKFKAVNGINNGPKSHATIQNGKITWALDASAIYQELGIPYVRTHDAEYPNGSDAFIDIHCIFPDFTKDPDDQKAYRFQETDEYIKNILDSGAQVVYRLGESIAESADQVTYQVPPTDYQKWANICSHIVAHYTDGWNKGFTYKMVYWEIWNEPDQKRQWNGELKEYYALYKQTARLLKKRFPNIKIGGGAFSSVTEELLKEFLTAINDDGKKTPLDFYSWHIYTNQASDFTYRANMVRKVLDDQGYQNTETFAGEWNYVDDWENIETTWDMIHSYKIASFYAACLITLQNSHVDGAMYYDGSLTGEYAKWCGLYDDKGVKEPGYYGFLAFARLQARGRQVEVKASRDPVKQGVYVCGATGTNDAILIANTNDSTIRFRLEANSKHQKVSLMRVNADHPESITTNQESLTEEEFVEMMPYEMLLIVFE